MSTKILQLLWETSVMTPESCQISLELKIHKNSLIFMFAVLFFRYSQITFTRKISQFSSFGEIFKQIKDHGELRSREKLKWHNFFFCLLPHYKTILAPFFYRKRRQKKLCVKNLLNLYSRSYSDYMKMHFFYGGGGQKTLCAHYNYQYIEHHDS